MIGMRIEDLGNYTQYTHMQSLIIVKVWNFSERHKVSSTKTKSDWSEWGHSVQESGVLYNIDVYRG